MFITPRDGARIVQELKNAIGYDVNIMDRTGTILASTDPRRVGQTHAAAQRILRERLPELSVPAEAWPMQSGVNLPIEVDGVREGVIGITGPLEQVAVYGTIAKKMTEILLTSLRQQEQQALLERTRSLFIEQWLFSAAPDWAALAAQGQLLGVDTALPRRVALLAPDTADAASSVMPRLLQAAEARLRREPDCLWATVNQRLLILFSGASLQAAPRLLREVQREAGLPLTGGLSTASRDAADLRRCYGEARIAARVGAQTHTVRAYDGVSLEFLLHGLDPKLRQDVLHAVLPPAVTQQHPDLLEALRLYFRHNGSIEAAAKAACVHENTLRYRLQTLARRTGYDVRRPKDAAMLCIALTLCDSAS